MAGSRRRRGRARIDSGSSTCSIAASSRGALALDQLEPPLIALTLHPASLEPERAGEEAEAVVLAVDAVLDGAGRSCSRFPTTIRAAQQVRGGC